MRTFLLLVLAFAIVTGAKVRDVKRLLLMEGLESAKETRRHGLNQTLNQYVKSVVGCSTQTFCQIAAVLTDTDLDNSELHRQLYAYAVYSGHFNCTVTTSDEIQMRALLDHVIQCMKSPKIR